MKKIIVSLTTFLLMAVSCINQKQEGVVVASVDAFEQKVNEPEVQLIDVRTAAEYTDGYIANATNIDVLQSDFKDKVSSLDKEKPVMVYCKMGGRSAKAAGILKEMGFHEVTDLEGGITAWKAANKEIQN